MFRLDEHGVTSTPILSGVDSILAATCGGVCWVSFRFPPFLYDYHLIGRDSAIQWEMKLSRSGGGAAKVETALGVVETARGAKNVPRVSKQDSN